MGRSRRLSEQILVHLSKKDTERNKFSSVKQQGKASRENLRGTKSSVVLRGTKALRGKALGGVKGGTERYKGKWKVQGYWEVQRYWEVEHWEASREALAIVGILILLPAKLKLLICTAESTPMHCSVGKEIPIHRNTAELKPLICCRPIQCAATLAQYSYCSTIQFTAVQFSSIKSPAISYQCGGQQTQNAELVWKQWW